jgi:hypothetical protein
VDAALDGGQTQPQLGPDLGVGQPLHLAQDVRLPVQSRQPGDGGKVLPGGLSEPIGRPAGAHPNNNLGDHRFSSLIHRRSKWCAET